jgi:hypothetical protein
VIPCVSKQVGLWLHLTDVYNNADGRVNDVAAHNTAYFDKDATGYDAEYYGLDVAYTTARSGTATGEDDSECDAACSGKGR